MITLLNDEQRQLKDSAQEFLANKAPVAALRQLRSGRRVYLIINHSGWSIL